MPEKSPLPVTERTRHRRLREQGSTDRADLAAILAAGVICHLGVVVDGYPMVVPTVYGLDGDTLYLHGSVASRSLVAAPEATVCVTVTHVDGLVLARSVFEHSVNYRCAMVYGVPRPVADPPDDGEGPDAALGLWAGQLPLRQSWGEPVPDPVLPTGIPVPPHIAERT